MSLRRLPRRLLALLLGGLAAGVVVVACSIPTKEDGGPRASACSEGCPETDGSTDGPTEAAQIGFDGGTDQPPRNANCGAPAECNPDPGEAAWSCQGTLVQQPSSSPGSFPTPSGPLDADLAGSKPPVEATRPVLACQILRKSSEAAAECVRSGQATEGEACRGVFPDDSGALRSDCAPGLACVRGTDPNSDTGTGQCRPYCCFGQGCTTGSWCTPRRLFETATAQDPLFVPVCAPADNCTLLDPAACAPGQACVLVADRTTSCDVPGKGVSGQSCPCAAGFVCARDTSTCRAICRVGIEGDCAEGLCVGGGNVMPPGFGLCVVP